MTWTTPRLSISPLRRDDAPELFAALSDPVIGRFLGGPDVESLPWLEERIGHLLAGPADPTAQTWLNFVVRLRAGGAPVIGRLEATVYDGWCEVAWVLGPPFWAQGYGAEGGRWLLDHLREEFGVLECWATVHPENAASLALLRRLGFVEQTAPWAREVESYDEGDVVMGRLG